MSNPSRHSLLAKRIEAGHIVKCQIKLSHHPLITGELCQPPVELNVGPQNIRQSGCSIAFRCDDGA